MAGMEGKGNDRTWGFFYILVGMVWSGLVGYITF